MPITRSREDSPVGSNPENGETLRTNTVLLGVERMRGTPCRVCSRPICGHEAVVCIAMGYGSTPHCLGCLAKERKGDREGFRDRMLAYILERECCRNGWLSASEQEGFRAAVTPGCLWPAGDDRGSDAATGRGIRMGEGGRGVAGDVAVEWDAGDSGCGDLVMELRLRLNAMKPGELLKLTARDPGAREDLPAWCRLTGHGLVESGHPTYLIRRREE